MRDVIFIKLGGSLITDKQRPATARPEVIERLAAEIAGLRGQLEGDLVLGHGSGSFGHAAAARFHLQDGFRSESQRPGISEVRFQAASLHHLVLEALERAGALPFTIAPSSAMVTAAGRPVGLRLEPLLLALGQGLLPVLFGDVVLDRRQGVSICSTETVFIALARRFHRRGISMRMLWLGDTRGIYDRAGETIPTVSGKNIARVRRQIGAPVGEDVTGGMLHRLQSARTLARLGIPSWILDGRQPGVMARALQGSEVQGTEITVVE